MQEDDEEDLNQIKNYIEKFNKLKEIIADAEYTKLRAGLLAGLANTETEEIGETAATAAIERINTIRKEFSESMPLMIDYEIEAGKIDRQGNVLEQQFGQDY